MLVPSWLEALLEPPHRGWIQPPRQHNAGLQRWPCLAVRMGGRGWTWQYDGSQPISNSRSSTELSWGLLQPCPEKVSPSSCRIRWILTWYSNIILMYFMSIPNMKNNFFHFQTCDVHRHVSICTYLTWISNAFFSTDTPAICEWHFEGRIIAGCYSPKWASLLKI